MRAQRLQVAGVDEVLIWEQTHIHRFLEAVAVIEDGVPHAGGVDEDCSRVFGWRRGGGEGIGVTRITTKPKSEKLQCYLLCQLRAAQ